MEHRHYGTSCTFITCGNSDTINATDRLISAQEQNEARRTIQAQEAEAVRRVEALAPPVEVKPERIIKTVSLVLHNVPESKLEKIKPLMLEIKKIADMEGIRYE